MSAMEAGHYASREWLRLNGRPPEAIWEWRDLERVIVQGAAPYLQAEALREAADDPGSMGPYPRDWLRARAHALDALTAEGTGNGASGSVGSARDATGSIAPHAPGQPQGSRDRTCRAEGESSQIGATPKEGLE